MMQRSPRKCLSRRLRRWGTAEGRGRSQVGAIGPLLDHQVPPEALAERIVEPVNGAQKFWTEMSAQDIRVSRHFVGVSLFNKAFSLCLSVSLSPCLPAVSVSVSVSVSVCLSGIAVPM